MNIIYFLIFITIITIIFIIYSEYSVGNILFRPDSTGKITMNFRSFDIKSASKSLRLYESENVPALEYEDVPDEITKIEFTSNLKNSTPYEKGKKDKLFF